MTPEQLTEVLKAVTSKGRRSGIETGVGVAETGLKGLTHLQKLFEKKPDSTLRRAAKWLGLGAGLTAGGTIAAGGVEKITDVLSKPIHMQSMMEQNPDLVKYPKKDVETYFNTLQRFSPLMAADPLVSGSWMRKALQYRDVGIDPRSARELIEASTALAGLRGHLPRTLRETFSKPLKGMGIED